MSTENDWTIERIKNRLERIKTEIDEIYIILKDINYNR